MENLKTIKEELKDININNLVFFDMKYKEELKTVYDNRQSFYKKALVYQNYTNNITALQSYNTMICAKTYLHNNYYLIFNDYYINSNTTQRHIKEYLKQYILPYNLKDINITSDDIYYISKINLIDDIISYFNIKLNIFYMADAVKHFKNSTYKEEEKKQLLTDSKNNLKNKRKELKTLLQFYNI